VNCRGAIASWHLRIGLLQSIHAVVDNHATHTHPKVRESMIRKSAKRFSEKIMLKQ
jgi:hypothetical protein